MYEFVDALKGWTRNYNEDYPHSALDYLTPAQFEAKVKDLETRLTNQTDYSIFSYT